MGMPSLSIHWRYGGFSLYGSRSKRAPAGFTLSRIDSALARLKPISRRRAEKRRCERRRRYSRAIASLIVADPSEHQPQCELPGAAVGDRAEDLAGIGQTVSLVVEDRLAVRVVRRDI